METEFKALREEFDRANGIAWLARETIEGDDLDEKSAREVLEVYARQIKLSVDIIINKLQQEARWA